MAKCPEQNSFCKEGLISAYSSRTSFSWWQEHADHIASSVRKQKVVPNQWNDSDIFKTDTPILVNIPLILSRLQPNLDYSLQACPQTCLLENVRMSQVDSHC